MDRRVLIRIGVLVVSGGFALYMFPKGLLRKTPPDAAVTASAPAPASSQAAPVPQPAPALSRDELAAWRERHGQAWRRDPFLTAREEHELRAPRPVAALAPAPPSAPLPSYTVKAVLIAGSAKIALINERLVAEGELLGEERVVEISRDGVVLARAGQRRRVDLWGVGVPVIKREPGFGPPR